MIQFHAQRKSFTLIFLHFIFDYIPWKFKSRSLDEIRIKRKKKKREKLRFHRTIWIKQRSMKTLTGDYSSRYIQEFVINIRYARRLECFEFD